MTRAIDTAITQLGIAENSGHNDGVPAERYMRGDELAWCCGFVLYCNEHSDDPLIAKNQSTYYKCRTVTGFIAYMRERGVFWPRSARAPQANDIIFFGKAFADVGVKGNHVGIVEFLEGGRVHTVEGNTSNKVARRSYLTSDGTILGYARPGPLRPTA